MEYFSDKENGAVSRTVNDIPHNVWLATAAYINSLVEKGYFGEYFPEFCQDGYGCIGTSESSFKSALLAEVPNIEWPLVTEILDSESRRYIREDKIAFTPNYLEVLDLIQFCFKHIGKPIEGGYHDFFKHYHINSFDENLGRTEFAERINTYFSRNKVAYELKPTGDVVRILNPILENIILNNKNPREKELRNLLSQANKKIFNYDVAVRYDALKDLWDYWERAKTIYNPTLNKKESTQKILESISDDVEFREILEEEAKSLTRIGNAFFIRHSEITQVKINDSEHIEYLFQRMYSLINLISKKLD